MYGSMSNYTMNTVMTEQLDKGVGVLLAIADDKPRVLLSASVYSVTNTTNTIPILAMCPSTTLGSAQTIDTSLQNVAYLLKSSEVLDSTYSSTNTPNCLVPFVGTRAGGAVFPIIPPGWMLFGVAGELDLNGKISWQVCTADME